MTIFIRAQRVPFRRIAEARSAGGILTDSVRCGGISQKAVAMALRGHALELNAHSA